MITLEEHFLINIRPNWVRVENLKSHNFLESGSELTFGNDRLLIADTKEPEETLRQLINQLSPVSLINPYRTIVLNPYHPNIPTFTDVEKMFLRDMGEHLGARVLWFRFGENITSRQLDINSLEIESEV